MTRKGKIALVIVLGGGLMVFLVGCILLIGLLTPSKPKVDNDVVLEIKFQGDMPESSTDDPLLKLIGGGAQTSFRDVLANINRAKTDNHIKGILLLIDNPTLGLGRIDDLRDALEDFKQASKKPIYAYMESGSDRDYALAITADKIYVAPVGQLMVKGFAAHATFMKGFFDKIKVEPNLSRHGKYKSFVERYTRQDMSEPDREQISALLDDYYGTYVQSIAKARQKTAEQVQQLIDQGPYTDVKKAKEVGLIDDTLYFDQVKDQIKSQLKMNKYDSIASTKYAETEDLSIGGKRDKIAIIYATGTIKSGKSNSGTFSEESIGSETVADAIKKAREDSDIKAIILRVNSPGGSALASDIIWREVKLTREAKKPIVACMSDVAASGGYYISMATDKIIAQPNTITGSIGVFGGKFNINGLYKDYLGLNTEAISRGKHADMYSEYRNFDAEEMAKMDEYMDSFYKEFITKVAEGRNMKVEDVDALGQGRVWSGVRGKEKGLVDELGGIAKAIKVAKELAKLPADSNPMLIEMPKHKTLLEGFLGGSSDDARVQELVKQAEMQRLIEAQMPQDMRETVRTLSVLKDMENEHIFALMPYQISIR